MDGLGSLKRATGYYDEVDGAHYGSQCRKRGLGQVSMGTRCYNGTVERQEGGRRVLDACLDP